MEMQQVMEVAGAIGYFRKLSVLLFFAACSLIGFGWYVVLFMQVRKKHRTTKMEQTTEQMMACLLAEIRTNRAEMKAVQEKMGDGQEEMKAQVGSLASRINAN
jgi:uncharacterized protein HemX